MLLPSTTSRCGCGGLILLKENYIFDVNEKQIFDKWNCKYITTTSNEY